MRSFSSSATVGPSHSRSRVGTGLRLHLHPQTPPPLTDPSKLSPSHLAPWDPWQPGSFSVCPYLSCSFTSSCLDHTMFSGLMCVCLPPSQKVIPIRNSSVPRNNWIINQFPWQHIYLSLPDKGQARPAQQIHQFIQLDIRVDSSPTSPQHAIFQWGRRTVDEGKGNFCEPPLAVWSSPALIHF